MAIHGRLENALYALQGLLICARSMAYDLADERIDANKPSKAKELADLLDTAEYLPRLIANDADETDNFRGHLASAAHRFRCSHLVLDRFDNPIPPKW
jgi:hypothetical protein